MADGQNERRAIRVAELMNDYRTLQHYIAQVQATPSNGDYNEEGYSILRQCSNDAQALLSATFTDMQSGGAGLEGEKGQLQGIMIDASVRRFLAQRIYLRATAATRWASSRAAILQGHKAHAGHALALQQVDNQLRAELYSISDERILTDLRTADWQAGRWIDEDPAPDTVLSYSRTQR